MIQYILKNPKVFGIYEYICAIHLITKSVQNTPMPPAVNYLISDI